MPNIWKALGFFLSIGFNYAFTFIEKYIQIEDIIPLDANIFGEIFFCFTSFIILIINCILFREPKINDITKINHRQSKKDLGQSGLSIISDNEISTKIRKIKKKKKKKKKMQHLFFLMEKLN